MYLKGIKKSVYITNILVTYLKNPNKNDFYYVGALKLKQKFSYGLK